MGHIRKNGDNALLDALLHAQDVAYDAHSFRKLLTASGLVFADHCEPFQKMVYDLRCYGLPDNVCSRISALDVLDRKRFLELFHGRLSVQSAYASKGPAHRAPFTEDMIPHQTLFSNIRWKIDRDGRAEVRDSRFGGVRFRNGPLVIEYLRRIDNQRTNGEILDEMNSEANLGQRDTSLHQLHLELEPIFYYDLVTLCDRPFRSKLRTGIVIEG